MNVRFIILWFFLLDKTPIAQITFKLFIELNFHQTLHCLADWQEWWQRPPGSSFLISNILQLIFNLMSLIHLIIPKYFPGLIQHIHTLRAHSLWTTTLSHRDKHRNWKHAMQYMSNIWKIPLICLVIHWHTIRRRARFIEWLIHLSLDFFLLFIRQLFLQTVHVFFFDTSTLSYPHLSLHLWMIT